jgi:hypothetical protein
MLEITPKSGSYLYPESLMGPLRFERRASRLSAERLSLLFIRAVPTWLSYGPNIPVQRHYYYIKVMTDAGFF